MYCCIGLTRNGGQTIHKHSQNWSNRLVAGDSLLVMNSLLQKEGMTGKIQMIYVDPPYGIRYSSNFQPFINKREVKDGSDEDLTLEPEMIKAFRDTWDLGIHSYLTYHRDRLLLAKMLLNETGSIFVQINDENVHHVRELLSQVFGENNYVAQIQYRTSGSLSSSHLKRICDYVLWKEKRKIFEESIKDNKKWLTIGYRRSTNNYNEVFKLYNRNRSSDISILQTEELSYDDVVERIINVQSILETALGKEVCDCCFPESITTTLSQFNE
jgi:adenine specific DNA methylase Mod